MHLIAHLNFDGQCEAAFKHYKECLGGEITLMLTYGSQSTASSPFDMEDKIFHATLKVGDQTLTGVDVAHSAYETPRGFAVQLNIEDPNEARRIYDSLSEHGSIHLALQKTSWAGHYAYFTDCFGIPWEVNCAA